MFPLKRLARKELINEESTIEQAVTVKVEFCGWQMFNF